MSHHRDRNYDRDRDSRDRSSRSNRYDSHSSSSSHHRQRDYRSHDSRHDREYRDHNRHHRMDPPRGGNDNNYQSHRSNYGAERGNNQNHSRYRDAPYGGGYRPRGRGGYNNSGYGGYRGGGGRGGRRGGYGGGRGGFRNNMLAKARYSCALSDSLLEDIARLSMDCFPDNRGPQKLREWVDPKTSEKYQESRFKAGKAIIVGKNKLISISQIPASAQVTSVRTSKWMEGLPTHVCHGKLSFARRVELTTNSIPIEVKSLNLHQYTMDVFCKESKQVAFSADSENKRKIYDLCKKMMRRKHRELYPHIFDNMHVFSFASIASPASSFCIECIELDSVEYRVEFALQLSTSSDSASFYDIFSANAGLSLREQGLNLVNRERFQTAGYIQLHWRDSIFYNLGDSDAQFALPQNGCDLTFPDLTILQGFKSSVHYASDGCLVKTTMRHRAMTAHTVHDMIDKFGVESVDAFVRGKRGITNYAPYQMIDNISLDSSLNLDSTFSLDSANGAECSYRDYYTKKKNIALPFSEKCMIAKEIRRKGTVIKTHHFCPQHVHIVVSNEFETEKAKSEMRSLAHLPIRKVIDDGLKINKMLNNVAKTSLFSTRLSPLKVNAYELNEPMIAFLDRNGNEMKFGVSDFGGKNWKNIGDFYGESSSAHSPSEWCIMFERKHSSQAEAMQRWFQTFMRARGFRKPPLAEARFLELDFTDLSEIKRQILSKKYSLVLVILDNDMEGSKNKISITRAVYFSNSVESRLSIELQFVLSQNCGKKQAAFNIFESLLLKSGKCLYSIDPCIPCKKWDLHDLWMIGMRVFSDKKKKSNICVVSLMRKPFAGALKCISSVVYPMRSKQSNVIPCKMMQMCVSQLISRLSASDYRKIRNIIVIRANGSDGQFETIVSKEIAGIRRALNDFRDWYPALTFCIIQERCDDAFDTKKAVACTTGITSHSYLDFCIAFNRKQDRNTIIPKTLRVIVLSDEYSNSQNKKGKRTFVSFAKDTELFSDFIQIIYSQFWAYAPAVPFMKKPSIPACLKYAEHYVDWYNQLITDKDRCISDVSVDANIQNCKPKLLRIT